MLGFGAYNIHSPEMARSRSSHRRDQAQRKQREAVLSSQRLGRRVGRSTEDSNETHHPPLDLIIWKLINRRNGKKQIHTHLNNDAKSENTISFFFFLP